MSQIVNWLEKRWLNDWMTLYGSCLHFTLLGWEERKHIPDFILHQTDFCFYKNPTVGGVSAVVNGCRQRSGSVGVAPCSRTLVPDGPASKPLLKQENSSKRQHAEPTLAFQSVLPHFDWSHVCCEADPLSTSPSPPSGPLHPVTFPNMHKSKELQ